MKKLFIKPQVKSLSISEGTQILAGSQEQKQIRITSQKEEIITGGAAKQGSTSFQWN